MSTEANTENRIELIELPQHQGHSPYPPLRSISELRCVPEDDHSYLLRNRLLRHGEVAALVGNAGLGKSTTATQLAMMWSSGMPALGLEPLYPMRVVLVQGENDEAEMSLLTRGIRSSLELSPEGHELLENNFRLAEVHVGQNLIGLIEEYVRQHAPDLVVLDPLFVYFSGEVSSSTEFGRFLRSLATLFKRLDVAALLVHHTGKRRSTPGGRHASVDPVYGSIGSSEFANVARIIFTLDHVDQRPDLARLMIGKRGGRSPWRNSEGHKVSDIVLQRSHDSSVPFWTRYALEAIEPVAGTRNRLLAAREAVLQCLQGGERDRIGVFAATHAVGVSRESCSEALRVLQEEGTIVRLERPRTGTRAQIIFRLAGNQAEEVQG